MPRFTVRVELHDATWRDYTDLHTEMRRRGFSTTISTDSGAAYHLPPAEYGYENSVTRDVVLEKAKAAAAAVRTSYSVLVTQSAGRTWHNLEPA